MSESVRPRSRPSLQVVLLGDSHFARLGRLEIAALGSASPIPVTVHNHAFGGSTSVHLAERAAFEARLAPARFLISIGTNDLAPWKRVPLDEFQRNMQATLQNLDPIRVAVLDLLPIDESAPDLAGDPDKRTTAEVTRYREALVAVVTASGGTLIRIADPVAARTGMLLDDGVHLSEAGNALLITSLAEHLATRDPLRIDPPES